MTRDTKLWEIKVFNPNQIKSATDNTGEFLMIMMISVLASNLINLTQTI